MTDGFIAMDHDWRYTYMTPLPSGSKPAPVGLPRRATGSCSRCIGLERLRRHEGDLH